MVTWVLLGGMALAGGPGAGALQAFVEDFGQDGLNVGRSPHVAEAYQAACGAGHALSCGYEAWFGGDRAAVLAPARAACGAGDPLGCVVAGWMLGAERGGILQPELETAAQARALFQQACDAGYARGCTELGFMEKAAGNRDKGRQMLQAACDQGVGNACMGAVDPDWPDEQRFALYLRGCTAFESLDPPSCYFVAEMLRKGTGTEMDLAGANGMYQNLCASGHGSSCNRLGQAYFSGDRGKPKDKRKAIAYYDYACNVDHEWGCANLGRRLAEGDGGRRRMEEGRRLLATACHTHEKAESCWALGRLEMLGAPAAGNIDVPWKHVQAACELGWGRACGWLGSATWSGLRSGTPDPVAASALWRQACEVQEERDGCVLMARHAEASGADAGPWLDKACEMEAESICKERAGGPRARAGGTKNVALETGYMADAAIAQQALALGTQASDECWTRLGGACRGTLLNQLLGNGQGAVGPVAPWMPAIRAACDAHHPASCLVLGRAELAGGRASEALAAWSQGCSLRTDARAVCDAAEEALETHRRSLSKAAVHGAQTALCMAWRSGHCLDAAAGFGSQGDLDRELQMVGYGCQSGLADACTAHKRLGGDPIPEGRALSAGQMFRVSMGDLAGEPPPAN